jgi:CBS domain-containing protein
MSATTRPLSRGSYLMPSLEHATVSDAMHPGILACEPDATVTEVAQMMATYHVHCLSVVGISHQAPQSGVWGVISDLDLVRAAIRYGDAPSARSIAQQPPVSVDSSTPLREAGGLMLAHDVTHLVVTQPGTRRPIGILSTADIAGVLAWGEA